jgi:hypothetical protein
MKQRPVALTLNVKNPSRNEIALNRCSEQINEASHEPK